ncbi:AUGMIN subunit 3 [Camellia lanceoleosa]|uniref:AUGMIN subunit 3 n=1 Tax=Camellia lanceoleosa TaxID=1840588 RepID=A0ACC0F8V7_9ERIC|nr:AUGMIN subunit 3 [Camellia lanceoleosa]
MALKAQVTSDEAHIHLDLHFLGRKHVELVGELSNLYHKEVNLLSETIPDLCWELAQLQDTYILQGISVSNQRPSGSLPSIDVQEQGALDTFRYLLSIHSSNDSTFSSMCPSLRLYRVIGAADAQAENAFPEDRNRCINELCTLIQSLQQLVFLSSTTGQPILTPWLLMKELDELEKINAKLSAAVEEVTLDHCKKCEIVKHHSQEAGICQLLQS